MSTHSGIHPTAIIDSTAEIAAGVEIGPYSIIGPHCQVGEGTKIGPHALLESHVRLGSQCEVSPGAVLGGKPQDLKFKGETSWAVIGDRCVIREGVTVNRASGEEKSTTVGNGCLLMACSHVGHNARVGNEVILANAVVLGGHVEVGDYAFIGGIVAIHQNVRIGKMAIISGFSASRQDIPPFAMADGRPAIVAGINKVGLKRRGFDLAARTRLKQAYHLLFFSGLNYKQAIETIHAEIEPDSAIEELITFIQESQRGIYRPNRILRSAMDDPDSVDPGNLVPFSDVLVEVP